MEDVKTVFRLTPCITGGCGWSSSHVLLSVYLISLDLTQFKPLCMETFECVSEMKMNMSYLALFVLIPARRIFVRHIFNKYFPSMLKMMGAGYCVCLVTTVVKLVVGSVGHFYNNASRCIICCYRYYSYTTILQTVIINVNSKQVYKF